VLSTGQKETGPKYWASLARNYGLRYYSPRKWVFTLDWRLTAFSWNQLF
jgi:hypothetical protein